MSWIAYLFANGDAFYIGCALMFVANLIGANSTTSMARRIALVILLGGVLIVALSATPFPYAFYLAWAGLGIAWICQAFRPQLGPCSWRIVRVAFPLSIIVAVAMESQRPNVSSSTPLCESIYVIGDSISAGTTHETNAWPAILARQHHVPVVNLAVPGATTHYAAGMLARINDDRPRLIIIELGGNDLLGRDRTPVRDFQFNLEQLIRQQGLGAHLVMLELPLPPFANNYGLVQRRLARYYRIPLIPKRRFAAILRVSANTTDGLHLSPVGHGKMADMIWDFIAPLMSTSAVNAVVPPASAAPGGFAASP